MKNLSFSDMAHAVIIAYSGRDGSFPFRVQFWTTQFGKPEVTTLVADDVLSAASINWDVAALGTVFKDAPRMRLLPRGFSSPMHGVSRQ